MKKTSSIIYLSLLTSIFFTMTASGEIATRIPLTVNVVEGCNVSDEEIRAVVAEANKVMKPNMISYEVRQINYHVTGANPDGSIAGTQEHGIVTKAMDELKTSNGGYNGMKIFYGNSLRDDGRWGQAYHADNGGHWYSVPVVFMKNRPGSIQSKGNDLAHELAHSLTLVGQKPVSGSFAGQSDQWGHMTEPFDSDNLMYRYNSDAAPRGKKLAPEQIKEIKENAQRFGRNAVVTPSDEFYQAMHPRDDIIWDSFGPRVLWVDDPEETYFSPLFDDLAFGYFFAESTTAGMVEILINMAGGFLNSMPVEMDINIYLDIDNNLMTGTQLPGLEGFDRIINIELNGIYPNVSTVARIETFNGQILQYVPFAMTSPVLATGDYEEPLSGIIEHFTDSIFLTMPVVPLGLTANIVPIKIISENSLDMICDEVEFEWNTMKPEEPEIQLVSTPIRPDEPIEITGQGFTPFEAVEIYLDDELLDTTIADNSGNINCTLPYPTGKEHSRYFLVARDVATNQSGYSILTLLGRTADINNDRMVGFEDFIELASQWLSGEQ